LSRRGGFTDDVATARSRSIDRAIASNLDARFDATTTLSIAIDAAAARRARV